MGAIRSKFERKGYIKDDSRQKLLTRFLQKKSKQQTGKRIGEKNLNGNERKRKQNEILILTRELAATTKDLEKALGEVKLLNNTDHDTARKNGRMKQEKIMCRKTQTQLNKSEKLNHGRWKTQALENPHKPSTLQYADPQYFDVLQEENFLLEEPQKKRNLLESKLQLQDKLPLKKQIRDQKKIIKTQTQLKKSEKLNQKSRKTKALENPHKLSTLQYADPHYFDVLQEENFLLEEPQKKLNLLESKQQLQDKFPLKKQIRDLKKIIQTQTQLKVSEKLNQESRITKALENPHKLSTLQYADPYYFDVLEQKNFLRKEPEKKLNQLQSNLDKLSRKNEIMDQKKIGKTQTQLNKSEKLFNQERRKTEASEVNLKENPLNTLQYADPHYFDVLREKNFLQKELQKKLNLLQSKDDQLGQQDKLYQKMKDMLKRRPCNLIEEPDAQIIEYYRTIRFQTKKIKSVAAQVNMYLSGDKYKKLNSA